MRAFIGADFDNDVKNEIYELQQRIKRYSSKGRWERIENLHLTLKFLGEISISQKEQIDLEMNKLCISRNPFVLEISDMGIFDSKDSARVLWLGVSGEINQLQSFHKEIEKLVIPIGFPAENRKFSPHITIARDIIFDCEFEKIKHSIGNIKLSFTKVDSLFLFKSDRIQNKQIYSKMTKYPFKANR